MVFARKLESIMSRKSSTRTALVATLGALALFAAPALAQSSKDKLAYDATYYDDEIIVIAPGVHRETTDRSSTGAPIETLTTRRVVTAVDLDLRTDAGADELRRRIRDTAVEACAELDRVSSGVPLTSDRECIRDAQRDALAEADALISYRRG